MTTRQPQTAQEAAMLGLIPFPAPNLPRGLFGGSRRRPLSGTSGMSPVEPGSPTAYVAARPDTMAPPSIDQAPPPPSNWPQLVGPDLMGQLPVQPVASAPAMRGGPFGAPRSLIGSTPPAGVPADSATPQMGIAHDQKKKGGFDFRMLAGILGDALLGANGQAPMFAQTRIRENQAAADHRRRLAEMAQEWQFRNSQPDYATVGNRRFAYNPATGESQTLYVAPSEAQDYAAALGAQPGTEEYNTLMADYVLRHSGPTATANAMQEEDNRQSNRVSLEGVRQQNRIGMEGVRQGNRLQLRGSPTYRETHPRPTSGGRGGSAAGSVREGQTATNPKTGEKVVYRGGKWVPVK